MSIFSHFLFYFLTVKLQVRAELKQIDRWQWLVCSIKLDFPHLLVLQCVGFSARNRRTHSFQSWENCFMILKPNFTDWNEFIEHSNFGGWLYDSRLSFILHWFYFTKYLYKPANKGRHKTWISSCAVQCTNIYRSILLCFQPFLLLALHRVNLRGLFDFYANAHVSAKIFHSPFRDILWFSCNWWCCHFRFHQNFQ